MAALGAFFLAPYVPGHIHYPVGWDSPFYVWRARAVSVDGLGRIGTIRAGSPLLLAVLMKVTGQSALTMVAILPAVLAGAVGLGAAAMVRSALGARAAWVPVVALLSWFAFGRIGMMDGHLDNVLNVSVMIPGLAAATAMFARGRGAIAAAMLFMAGALAEWTFYVFAMGVFVLALLMMAWPPVRARLTGRRGPLGPVKPLLWSAGLSAAFTGLTFLSVPQMGGIGAGLGRPTLRLLLRERFLARIRDTVRYWSFPLAIAGWIAAARAAIPERLEPARRFFLVLMVSWTVVTILAGLAQLAGAPVAGGRIMYYFFVAPILTSVLVWWLAGRLYPRGAFGPVLAGAVVAVTLVVFGTVSFRNASNRTSWFEPSGVRQATAAGAYVSRYAPDRQVVYLMRSTQGKSTIGRWWYVVRATLPPEQVPKAHRAIGLPVAYLSAKGASRVQDTGATSTISGKPVVIVMRASNVGGFAQASATYPGHEVAPGVIALGGRVPPAAIAQPPVTLAETKWYAILLIGGLVVAALVIAGGGWSVALLPDDAVVRVAVSPALGVAAVTLCALAWDRVGLPLHGAEVVGPAILAAAAGWALGWAATAKRRRGAGGDPRGLAAGWGPTLTQP